MFSCRLSPGFGSRDVFAQGSQKRHAPHVRPVRRSRRPAPRTSTKKVLQCPATWHKTSHFTLKNPEGQSRALFSLSLSRYRFVLQPLLLLPCYRLLLLWINIVFLLIFMYVLGTGLLNLPCSFVGLTGISTSSQRSPYLNPVLGCLQGKYLHKCSLQAGDRYLPQRGRGQDRLFLLSVPCPPCYNRAGSHLTQNHSSEAALAVGYQVWAEGWAPAVLHRPQSPKGTHPRAS